MLSSECATKNVSGAIHCAPSVQPLPLPTIEEVVPPTETSAAVVESDVANYSDASGDPYRVEPRPWRRYWARMLDTYVFSLVIAVPILLIFPDVAKVNSAVLGMLILPLTIPLEALMLSSWGWTPGKGLMRVEVRNASGGKLPIDVAMARGIGVWIKGLGIGAPILSLFTHIAAFRRLNDLGETSWDLVEDCRVRHARVGAMRWLALTALLMAFIALMIAGKANM